MIPYARIPGNLREFPQYVGLSAAARAAYIEARCYSEMHRSDGHLPEHTVKREGWKRSAPKLVEGKLWAEVQGGYQIIDYLEPETAQRLRADINERSEQLRKRASSGGKARADGAQRDESGQFSNENAIEIGRSSSVTAGQTPYSVTNESSGIQRIFSSDPNPNPTSDPTTNTTSNPKATPSSAFLQRTTPELSESMRIGMALAVPQSASKD